MITTSHAAPPGRPPVGTDGAVDRHAIFPTPAFPFDTSPFGRLPPPLGAGGLEPRAVVRRAVIAVLVTWVPLALLSAAEGLAIRADPRESFLLDIGAYARYLVALPALVLAEAMALPRLGRIVAHFVTSGVLPVTERARYETLVGSARRLLSSRGVAVAITALAYASAIRLGDTINPTLVSSWATPITADGRTVSLAGWWRLLVSQPLYMVVALQWLWRAGIWATFLYRVTRLDLRLVASHPDRMGGLQFVLSSLRAFPLVAFALAATMAGKLAERMVFEQQPVTEFTHLIGVVVVIVVALFVAPLFTLRGPLMRLWSGGIFAYGELGSDLGQRFERRWIRPGSDVTDEALQAADFSAVTDAYGIIANVDTIRLIPLDVRSTLPLVGATLLPFIPLLLLAMPLTEMLKFLVNFLL